MRIEGFISLMGCVMLLFVLAVGMVSLAREVRDLAPPQASLSQR